MRVPSRVFARRAGRLSVSGVDVQGILPRIVDGARTALGDDLGRLFDAAQSPMIGG